MSEKEEPQTGNIMGTLPIPKLLLKIALPIIISMTIQGLYNVVDSIFVAKVGENALNAISLAYPVQNTMIAVSVGISVGMNALLSRSLGQKNIEKANKSAMNGLFLTLIAGIASVLFGLFGVKPFFASQTEIPEILAYGEDYLSICCVFGFTLFFTITLERTLQATGRSTYTMISQGCGAIVNIILDPIFIFGLCGMPRLEVTGAAIATVIGQAVSLILNIYFNYRHNHELSFNMKGFVPEKEILLEIGKVAVPSMAMGSAASILVYWLNQILLGFSVTATAVLGIYYRLQSFVFMPVYGLTNGMIPILAYNYGAGAQDRFMKALKLGLVVAISIMTTGMIIFQLFPEQLIRLFMEADAGEELLEMGKPAIKFIAYSFPVAGISLVFSCVFQALGKGTHSLLATVLRQLLIQLPVAYILTGIYGVTAVWHSFLIAETTALIFVGLLFRHTYKAVQNHQAYQ